MKPHPSPGHEQKPYKGPNSYQVEDRHIFFGRDQDSQQLVALVLSTPVTLLHATSGAGKTSLLNARVIPELESRGWTPVRIIPQTDPIESTRLAVLEAVLPPPEAEAQVLETALARLAPDRDATVDELLDLYDEQLAAAPGTIRELIRPIPLSPGVAHSGLSQFRNSTPFAARLLRSSIDTQQLATQLARLASPSAAAPALDAVSGATSVRELAAALRHPETIASYRELLREAALLDAPLPEFFQNLFTVLGRAGPGGHGIELVLIFDQFEELFTRFIDPGFSAVSAEGQPDWRLRPQFLRQLEELHSAATERQRATGEEATAREYPIVLRFVIAMRNEYIAQLDQAPRLLREVERAKYHLRLLERHQTEDAITQPARLYGYGYTRYCLRGILQRLISENRFVEPSHVQIVCDKLWRTAGEELSRRPAPTSPRARPRPREVSVRSLRVLGGTSRILRESFLEYLRDLDPGDQIATLDILDGLLTSGRTRNVVQKQHLVGAPFRNRRQRSRLLDRLIEQHFIREENRFGGVFVEISHEFLIPPILEAMSNDTSIRLRNALRVLERFSEEDFRSDTGRLLSRTELQMLHALRAQIEWPVWAAELMFRSALRRAPKSELLREWARRYEAYDGPPDALSFLRTLLVSRRIHTTLSLDQLRIVNSQAEALHLTADEMEVVLRSQLVKASPQERNHVVFWTQKLLSHAP